MAWAPIRLTKHDLQNALHLQRVRADNRRAIQEARKLGQLKQIETIERESRESQDQAQEEDSAVVDALVAQITACKERLDALHKKEMEELEKLRSSMSALDAELLDRRAADDGAAAKQRDLEAALREAQAKAQSLADQKELDDKAAARAAEQMRELNSQLHALKHKADVAAEAAER